MPKARKRRRLADAYTFPGFRPQSRVQGIFGDPGARLLTLDRRGKKRLLLARNPTPTEDEVRFAISGVLCRCGNYPHEVAAILAAGQNSKNTPRGTLKRFQRNYGLAESGRPDADTLNALGMNDAKHGSGGEPA